jgi:hypothetical protein
MRGFSDAKDHGARAKRAREGGTNTLGGEVRQWNGILSIGKILREPIFYNPRIGDPWNDRIQEKVGWELEDRKKRNECHIIRSSKHRRGLATERLKKNIRNRRSRHHTYDPPNQRGGSKRDPRHP